MATSKKVTEKKAVKKAAPAKARETAEIKKGTRKAALLGIRNKDDAQRVLRYVSDEKRFYCHDGLIINNIYDLKSALEGMSDHTYNHHVTEEKNDFARWVREVLIDDKLSHDLARCLDKNNAAVVVSARITWLQDRA